MFCTNCGKQYEGKFCPECGTPAQAGATSMAQADTESTVFHPIAEESTSFSNVSEPQGSGKPPKKKKRGCLIPLILFAFLAFSLIFEIVQTAQNPEQYRAKSVLAKELELTSEQETAMLDIFTQCGIGEITSASKFQSGDDHTSYHLRDEETSAYTQGAKNAIVVWVTNETKTVESIYFHDQDIYVDGTVVAPITDYYVNSADRESCRISAELAVNKLLSHPDTASYPAASGWRFGIEEGIITVQSSVTAQNDFGMKTTLEFQVKFKHGVILSLILDGTEYIQ